MAAGMAWGLKKSGNPGRVAVLLSDGECQEGSTWEAAMMAPRLKLDNLLAVVDYNKFQALGRIDDIVPLEPFADKWKSFNWSVREIDGHDHAQINGALREVPFSASKPSMIIAHTVKGKGVSFMENSILWHYKSPDAEQLKKALEELER
jgi:transketolase